MSPVRIEGKVTHPHGAPVANAQLRLISDLATLGAMPGAVVSRRAGITWSRKITGFSGHRWSCYTKYVAQQVAGITFAEFKHRVVAENLSLIDAGYIFKPANTYLLPQNDPTAAELQWARELTNFSGNRWACWEKYGKGKVVGLSWSDFKDAVVQHNPELAEDNFVFDAKRVYQLPYNPHLPEYEVVTTTTASGRYKIAGLPVGEYRIEVVIDGRILAAHPVTVTADLTHDVPLPLPLAVAMAAAADNFVRVSDTHFRLNGQPFKRFVGLNIQALVHYGSHDIGEMANSEEGHRRIQLQVARALGARVVRVFLPVKNRSAQTVGDRLENLLGLIKTESPDIYLIVALTNLYSDFGQFVQGDEGFYQQRAPGGKSILSREFFDGGYKQNYLPFVQAIVTRFQNEPNIFAWEPGNELMFDPDPALFIQFMDDVTTNIHIIDQNHLITTGMKSTQHTGLFKREPTHQPLRRQLLGLPHIDFVTVHRYTHGGPDADPQDDIWVDDDIELVNDLPKPLIVEEAGIVRQAENDRTDKLIAHMEKWFGTTNGQVTNEMMKNLTQGYLQWGFTAVKATGDGDSSSGIVPNTHSDFDNNCRALRDRAQALLGE